MKKTKLLAIATLVIAVTIGSASVAAAWCGGNGGCYGRGGYHGGYGNGYGGHRGGYGNGYEYGHGGYHGGYGSGYGPQAMTSEQQARWQDYDKKAAPLVTGLRAKQSEMDALYSQGEPDSAKAQALAGEIGEIQGQLYKLNADFGQRGAHDNYYGDAYGRGHNYGRSYGGHHGGHR